LYKYLTYNGITYIGVKKVLFLRGLLKTEIGKVKFKAVIYRHISTIMQQFGT